MFVPSALPHCPPSQVCSSNCLAGCPVPRGHPLQSLQTTKSSRGPSTWLTYMFPSLGPTPSSLTSSHEPDSDSDNVALETWIVQELCDRGTLSSLVHSGALHKGASWVGASWSLWGRGGGGS